MKPRSLPFCHLREERLPEEKVRPGKLKTFEQRFGTVVYVSDIDMTPEKAHSIYEDRWETEMVNKFYKTNITSTTREHNDYSVLRERVHKLPEHGDRQQDEEQVLRPRTAGREHIWRCDHVPLEGCQGLRPRQADVAIGESDQGWDGSPVEIGHIVYKNEMLYLINDPKINSFIISICSFFEHSYSNVVLNKICSAVYCLFNKSNVRRRNVLNIFV